LRALDRRPIELPKLSDDPKRRAGEEKCLADIERYDLHVLKVHGDSEWPEFAYSVGLFQRFGVPEIIILGLKGDLAHSLLNEIASRARQGTRFVAGDTIHDLLEGFEVVLRPVPKHFIEPHFGWAIWLYGNEDFPALQLVYPTTSGVWPWDSSASESLKTLQPILESAAIPDWVSRAV
jgi:hypothetical protein